MSKNSIPNLAPCPYCSGIGVLHKDRFKKFIYLCNPNRHWFSTDILRALRREKERKERAHQKSIVDNQKRETELNRIRQEMREKNRLLSQGVR